MVTKKQHYVPQGYLRNFSFKSPSGKEEQIFVFDKTNTNNFPTNIQNIACGQYFNDLPEEIINDFLKSNPEIKNKQIFENAFSEVEGKCSPILKDLIEALKDIKGEYIDLLFKNTIEETKPTYLKYNQKISNNDIDNCLKQLPINQNDKNELSVFLALQYLRTRESREIISEIKSGLIDLLAEVTIPNFHNDFKITIDSDHVKSIHILQILEQLVPTANYFLNQIWLFGINVSNIPLCTSDNPLVSDPNHIVTGRGHGLHTYGMSFNLPISPDYMILIFEESYFKNNFSHSNMSDSNIITLNDDNVIYYNDLQLKKCHSQIYSNSNNFDWAKELINLHPNLRKKDRKRIKVHKDPNLSDLAYANIPNLKAFYKKQGLVYPEYLDSPGIQKKYKEICKKLKVEPE